MNVYALIRLRRERETVYQESRVLRGRRRSWLGQRAVEVTNGVGESYDCRFALSLGLSCPSKVISFGLDQVTVVDAARAGHGCSAPARQQRGDAQGGFQAWSGMAPSDVLAHSGPTVM